MHVEHMLLSQQPGMTASCLTHALLTAAAAANTRSLKLVSAYLPELTVQGVLLFINRPCDA